MPGGMWGPRGPGIEPVSPALAGRFLTTGPPGKPSALTLFQTQVLSSPKRWEVEAGLEG